MFRSRKIHRSVRVIVVVLVCLMVSPLAEADDYSFLHSGPADIFFPSDQISLGNSKDFNEDTEDSHDVCACFVCMMALGESFSPEVFSPQAGELLVSVKDHVQYASHLPDIYRPPIA